MTTRSRPGATKMLRPVTAIPRKTTGSANSTSVTISMSRDIGARRYEFMPDLLRERVERSSCNTSQTRFAARHQIAWSQLDLEPAAASAHVDARKLGHGRVDVGLQPAPLPERADA